MFFYAHVLLLLQPLVPWLSIVTFNNDAKPLPKWILRKHDVSQIRPRLGGLPHLSSNFSIRLEHPNSRRTLENVKEVVKKELEGPERSSLPIQLFLPAPRR